MDKRVFIAGYYGFGNTGDEAILISMVGHLREVRPDLQITVASATPETTARQYGVQSILWSDAYAVCEAVRQADLTILGGGGIFHDYWGIDPDVVLTDSHWGISYYVGPAAMATVFRKPVMLYAVGVGPLFSEHSRRFVHAVTDAATVITVRDEGSKRLLASIGVSASRVSVRADPAFGFRPMTAGSPAQKTERLNVGVAIRKWDVGVDQTFWEREVAAGLDLFLETHDATLTFVPFQRLKEIVDDDPAVSERVQSLMKHRDRTAIPTGDLTPQQTYSLLAACGLVVGMRLHSLILSMSAGVPVVAIDYDAKVSETMRQAGLERFAIDIGSVDATLLAQTMDAALAEGSCARIQGLDDSARDNARIAVQILEGHASQPAIPAELADLLGRGLRALLEGSRNLRLENKRLFGEVEFYLRQSASRARQLESGAARIEELERLRSGPALSEAQDDPGPQRELPNDRMSERDPLAVRCSELEAELKRAGEAAGLAQEELEVLRRSLEEREAEFARRHRAAAALLEDALCQRAGQAAEDRKVRDSLLAHVAELEAERSAQRAALEALEIGQKQDRARAADLAGQLRSAEELRARTVSGLDQFRQTFESGLETYRSQRAWTLMVAVRKAYVLLTRQGWGALLRWAGRLPFAGMGRLEEYELRFPDVWNYMPDRLEARLDAPEARSADSAVEARAGVPAPRRLAGLLAPRRYDVVILPIFDFEFRFQRPQQIAAQFARQGHRVFWISPSRFLPLDAAERHAATALRENLWEVRLQGAAPPDLYGGELTGAQVSAWAQSLEALYRDFQIAESCAFLQFPYWRKAGLMLRERFGARLAYDCMDDWRNWTAEPRISDFSLTEEQRLVRECDVLLVSAGEFHERHEREGLAPILVRNAADFDFMSSARTNGLLAGVPHPIVGYYGAIADWFDVDLVERAAAARPDYQFVLIGQVHEIDASGLLAMPNVHLLGEKNYREIPLYLSHFDVCLIPFKLNKLTKAVDPVKLYEFLSQGKPVVATNMAELPRDADLMYIADGVEEFVASLDLALRESQDSRKRQARIEFAKKNTWAARVSDIDAAIAKSFPLVSLLIVTYNSEEFVEPCLDSIARNTSWPNYEVIVVDNNSTDATCANVQQFAKNDARVRLIAKEENLGFAGGNNLAADLACGEYLVYLNPDTIVTPGWLGRLIRHIENDPSVGAVAAVTNFSGNETKVRFSYGNVLEMLEFAAGLAVSNAGKSIEIPMAPLYCVLVPRKVYQAVGELDPAFEIGMFEDDDFSHRVKQAGYRLIAAEDCFIHHFGNGSFAKVPSGESVRIFEANRRRFEEKWRAPWKPHTVRAGLRSPIEDRRFTPEAFLTVRAAEVAAQSNSLVAGKLVPNRSLAGSPFNLQPGGQSALVVECANATPGTLIVMGDTILTTSYGGRDFLSGLVPIEFCSRPGSYEVYLVNDFGESNRLEFVVEDPSRSRGSGQRAEATISHPPANGLSVRLLQPGRTLEKEGFNEQPDGKSAIVVRCEQATPDTVIIMGGATLETSFGNETLVSGLVPAELYSRAGVQAVYLKNTGGESNRVYFVVERLSGRRRS